VWEQTAIFWEARDAWAAARSRSAGRASAKVAARAAYWTARTDAGKVGPPAAVSAWMARREGGLEAFIAGIQAAVPEALANAFDEHVSRLLFSAWRGWPVSSGFSKSSLTVTYGQRGDDVTARIENTAPYVYYIQGAPWNRLIVYPGATTARLIGETTVAELGRLT